MDGVPLAITTVKYNHRWTLPYWSIDLLIINGLAAAIRLLYFRGFGEADDVAYISLAQRLLARQNPFRHVFLFEGRPGVIIPTALSAALFGWQEWAIVLPTFLLSLCEITACYWIALKLADRRTAIVSALALSFFSFHWSYATTLCADIMGAALFWMGAALVIHVWKDAQYHKRFIREFWIGLLIGSSFSVKANTGFSFLPILVTMPFLILELRHESAADRLRHLKQLAWISVGTAGGIVLVLSFFWITSHDPLAAVHGELNFNRGAYAALYAAQWKELLCYYPKLIASGLFFENHQYISAPYGIFFILAFAASMAAFWKRVPWARFTAVWFLTLFALYEFWPLTLHPYAPIHRLPRHLAPLAVPGALLIGWAAVKLSEMGSIMRGMTAGLFVLFVWTSWTSVNQLNSFHRKCLEYDRAAYRYIRDFWKGPVACSSDLYNYFHMRDPDFNKHHPVIMLTSSRTYVPPGYLVIQGGHQRPTSSPEWAFVGAPSPSTRWILFTSYNPAPQLPQEALQFYLAESTTALTAGRGYSDRFSDLASTSCGENHWAMQDQIDLGDPTDFYAHHIQFNGLSALIARQLINDRGEFMTETGNSIRGSVTYTALNLHQNRPLCIVEMLPADQKDAAWNLQINNQKIPLATAKTIIPMGQWVVRSIRLPGNRVPLSSLPIQESAASITQPAEIFRINFYQPDDSNTRLLNKDKHI